MAVNDSFLTIASNGYTLLTEIPEGYVVRMLTREEADHFFEQDTPYREEVEGEALKAVQATL